MSEGSTIEWLQVPGTKPATWNPIIAWRTVETPDGPKRLRGWHCEHVHGGCVNCYAEKQNKTGQWMGTKLPYKPGHRADVEIELHEPTLLQPLHWKSPRTIFVCSMTDLYGAWVPDEWLDRIFAIAALCPQHIFIVLTKRPERMRDYLAGARDRADCVGLAMLTLLDRIPYGHRQVPWPLKNVWGLVSCSTQEDADAFIPIILSTPLAVRGVSLEPLLGSIDLREIKQGDGALDALDPDTWEGRFEREWKGTTASHDEDREAMLDWYELREMGTGPLHPALDWVIDGGESGKDPRDYDIDASRAIEAQCVAAGVAYFRKQLGGRPFERASVSEWPPHIAVGTREHRGHCDLSGFKHKKAGDPAEWPEDLRRREFPQLETAPPHQREKPDAADH